MTDAKSFPGVEYKVTAVESAIKILSDNRHAGHDYHLLERFEAGLALTGTEVKAAKDGQIQLKDSFAEVPATKPGC